MTDEPIKLELISHRGDTAAHRSMVIRIHHAGGVDELECFEQRGGLPSDWLGPNARRNAQLWTAVYIAAYTRDVRHGHCARLEELRHRRGWQDIAPANLRTVMKRLLAGSKILRSYSLGFRLSSAVAVPVHFDCGGESPEVVLRWLGAPATEAAQEQPPPRVEPPGSTPPELADSWLAPFLPPNLPEGSGLAAIANMDVHLRDRFGPGHTYRRLVHDLTHEPREELEQLLLALEDPLVPLAPSESILRRAARQEFTLLRALAHGVFLVHGALPPHDALPLLDRLGHDDVAYARMLAHAVLLRICGHWPDPSVRDLIFAIADFEQTVHRATFLAPSLGDVAMLYHPLAPAGYASIAVNNTPNLGYVDNLLFASLAAGDVAVAARCLRDATWLGLFFPTETMATLDALPLKLPALAEDVLATTLGVLEPQHPDHVAKFLRRRSQLKVIVRERRDPSRASKYLLERGEGKRAGDHLLRHRYQRHALVEAIRTLLEGSDVTHVLKAYYRRVLHRDAT